VCLAFISDYCVSFISDCRIDKQQSVSTIRLNFLDMMDTAEMEQKPVEKEKEFWRSERERDREKKKTGQLKGNWGINRAKKNDSSFFFFSFLVVCVYPIKINLFPCD
jgi:hypothetical protein